MLKCDSQYMPQYFKIWFVVKEALLKASGLGIKLSQLLFSEFQKSLCELSETCFSTKHFEYKY